jgi:hypothetical protein
VIDRAAERQAFEIDAQLGDFRQVGERDRRNGIALVVVELDQADSDEGVQGLRAAGSG